MFFFVGTGALMLLVPSFGCDGVCFFGLGCFSISAGVGNALFFLVHYVGWVGMGWGGMFFSGFWGLLRKGYLTFEHLS
jgi:hypothetical protein